MHDVSAVTHTNPPGFDVTVYNDTTAPPSNNGADHDTVTEPSPTESTTTSDADDGTVDGTIDAEAAEAAPVPDTFVAVTVNV